MDTISELRMIRQPLARKCMKDGHICSRHDEAYCGTYAFPAAMWRLGDCLMADTKLRTAVQKADVSKVRVGQQKQKKSRRS